jgi:hypothetical protein
MRTVPTMSSGRVWDTASARCTSAMLSPSAHCRSSRSSAVGTRWRTSSVSNVRRSRSRVASASTSGASGIARSRSCGSSGTSALSTAAASSSSCADRQSSGSASRSAW